MEFNIVQRQKLLQGAKMKTTVRVRNLDFGLGLSHGYGLGHSHGYGLGVAEMKPSVR